MSYAVAYNKFKYGCFKGTYGDMSSNTIKVMLVTSTFVFDATDTTIAAALSGGGELSCSGYTGGFGGSGRKTLGTKTITQDDALNRAMFGCANITWTGIGTADTYNAFVVFYEPGTAASDSDCIPISYHNVGTRVLDGGDEEIQVDSAEGLIQVV